MKTKLGPILTKTNVINFMTKIGLRLEMLVNTAPSLNTFVGKYLMLIYHSMVLS